MDQDAPSPCASEELVTKNEKNEIKRPPLLGKSLEYTLQTP
jgi:hypothetical protein